MIPNEGYDRLNKKFDKRRYSLDNQGLCFLTVISTEQQKIESVSFDVEAADDYHYQIEGDQILKLCETLSCLNIGANIAAAFTELIKSWDNPIRIAFFLQNAGIKYQVFYWY